MLDQFLEQLADTSWVGWLGIITGIAGVWLSIKEKVSAWLFFNICYAAYVYLSFKAGMYAAVVVNAAFIPISIYGWINWSRSCKEEASKHQVSRASIRHLCLLTLIVLSGTAIFGSLLTQYVEGAYLPYLDAFAMCSAFSAQWLLSQKHSETWLYWMVADAAYIILWGAQKDYLSVILFIVFIGLAIKGWREWQASINKTP